MIVLQLHIQPLLPQMSLHPDFPAVGQSGDKVANETEWLFLQAAGHSLEIAVVTEDTQH